MSIAHRVAKRIFVIASLVVVAVGLMAAGGIAMLDPWEYDPEFSPECAAHMGEPVGYTNEGWPEYKWQGSHDEMALCEASLMAIHDEVPENETVDDILDGEVVYAFTLEGPAWYGTEDPETGDFELPEEFKLPEEYAHLERFEILSSYSDTGEDFGVPEGCEDYFVRIDDFPVPPRVEEVFGDLTHYLWVGEDEDREMCDMAHEWGDLE